LPHPFLNPDLAPTATILPICGLVLLATLRRFVQVYGPAYQDVPFRKAMSRKSSPVGLGLRAFFMAVASPSISHPQIIHVVEYLKQ